MHASLCTQAQGVYLTLCNFLLIPSDCQTARPQIDLFHPPFLLCKKIMTGDASHLWGWSKNEGRTLVVSISKDQTVAAGAKS